MSDKLKQFEEKVRQADEAALIDSLIDHAKKADDNIEYYEAVKIIKKELLYRLDDEAQFEDAKKNSLDKWKRITGQDSPFDK